MVEDVINSIVLLILTMFLLLKITVKIQLNFNCTPYFDNVPTFKLFYFFTLLKMLVTIVNQDKTVSVDIRSNVNSKYLRKQIELLDNFRIKYQYIYPDHVSTRYYNSETDWNKYNNYFTIAPELHQD